MAKNKNETTEAPEVVESPETDAPEGTETEAPKAKVAKTPIDLTAFEASVKSTIDETDSGAEPSDENLGEVVEEFQKLEGRAKTAARRSIRDQILSSLDNDDVDSAQTLSKINSALETAGPAAKATKEKVTKAPVDPTEGHVKRGATLMVALTLHSQNPAEGVSAEAQTQIEALYNEAYGQAGTYLAWLNGGKEGDEPEASDVSKDAAKLVAAKKVRAASGGGGAVRTYNGPQRVIAKHIEQAFASVEVGTHLTVGEIVKSKSDEYGDDSPSAGAVSGALKSAKFASPGITPDEEGTTPYGATKSA